MLATCRDQPPKAILMLLSLIFICLLSPSYYTVTDRAYQEAAELAKNKVTSAVLTVNIGSDAKAIKRAIDEIRKVIVTFYRFVTSAIHRGSLIFHSIPLPVSWYQVSGDMSFLCISSDAEKLTVFAYATDAAVALKEGEGGLRANDWVSRTLQVTRSTQRLIICAALPLSYFIALQYRLTSPQGSCKSISCIGNFHRRLLRYFANSRSNFPSIN
jgi:hypothetical protein